MPGKLPSLDRLRALREVARTGGFSSAADALALTQPAVSNQIRQLEQQLGADLLQRVDGRAVPTPEGEILIEAAARAFNELETAIDEIARMRAEITGPLTLATGATAGTHLLPPVVADLRARYPGIELRILTGNNSDQILGVLEGSIDLGLLMAPVDHPHLQTRFFFRDRLLCSAPPSEAPETRRVSPRDLEGRHLVLHESRSAIRRLIDQWLEGADRRQIRVTEISDIAAQVAFVRAGVGWSIVSEIAVREDAEAGRIDLLWLDPPLHRDLVLVWRADRAARPVIAAALASFSAYAVAAPGVLGP